MVYELAALQAGNFHAQTQKNNQLDCKLGTSAKVKSR